MMTVDSRNLRCVSLSKGRIVNASVMTAVYNCLNKIRQTKTLIITRVRLGALLSAQKTDET